MTLNPVTNHSFKQFANSEDDGTHRRSRRGSRESLKTDRLMMNFPLLVDVDPGHWLYLAEGFDSMIFSFSGPSDSPYTNRVLRLFKSQNPEFRRAGAVPISDFTEQILIHQKFICLFVRPYLSSIDCGTPVSVPLDLVQQLSDSAQTRRSEARIRQGGLCLTSPVGLVHENHILPNSLVIEIKPKWGFLPDCALLPQDSPKRSVVRFQMMLRLKLKNGAIKTLSAYDPLDLFSESPERIEKALDALIAVPESNLKIFRPGGSTIMNNTEKANIIQFFVKNPALQEILALQKLDFWDIECLPPILKKAGNPSWKELTEDPTIAAGVSKFVSENYRIPKVADELKTLVEQMDRQTARIHIASFLISQSAKDCSVMITVPDADFGKAECFVIDFDLKQPELLISNYLKADREVMDAYLSSLQSQ
jgi:inositol-pentakisphosphate 2-kinase